MSSRRSRCSGHLEKRVKRSHAHSRVSGSADHVKRSFRRERNAFTACSPIAVSRVLEAVDTIPGTKQFILLVDTSTGTVTPEDNAAWTFDADLAILRDPAVKRIVVAGRRCEDIRVALLFAGVDETKIVTRRDKRDAADALIIEDGPETIAILYELYSEPVSREVVKNICSRLAAGEEPTV